MALWQYTFQVITKESFEFLHKDFIPSFGDYGFDDEPYWRLKLIDKSYFERIDTIIEKNKSWSNEVDLYGYQESNCFEVFFEVETNVVISVSFRIDFTSDYEQVLSSIIEFCILKGLIVLDEKLKVVPLNLELSKSIIENSPQVKKYNELNNKRI
jgi:hypothetical protein